MNHPMTTAFLRYARKQAKVFRKEPVSRPHNGCIGCQLDSKAYPGSCGYACLIITSAADRWMRALKAAEQAGER